MALSFRELQQGLQAPWGQEHATPAVVPARISIC